MTDLETILKEKGLDLKERQRCREAVSIWLESNRQKVKPHCESQGCLTFYNGVISAYGDLESLVCVDLICDKSKEPPCHLEPSTKLCQKCPLNKTNEMKP